MFDFFSHISLQLVFSQRIGRLVPIIFGLITSSVVGAQVNIASLVKVYSGNPAPAEVVTNPVGLPCQVVYGDSSLPSGGGTSQIVFNNSPATLALSYPSWGFSAESTSAMGNFYQLGADARMLQSAEVTMVTWARAVNYPALAASNSSGYYHPVTLTFYKVMANNDLVYLTEKTESILVPWRPELQANGTPYPYNGYAFRANFSFPTGTILPEKIMVMVSYDTQSSGFNPINVDGPYNLLNLALAGFTPSVGQDLNPHDMLTVIQNTWYYPSTGWLGQNGPMMKLRALNSRTITPPVKAGSYQVTATISDLVQTGQATATLNIEKTTASVVLQDLTKVFTGTPKAATAVTVPAGLNVAFSYTGTSIQPSAVGSYAVSAVVNDPNYSGTATGALIIQDPYNVWTETKIRAGKIVPNLANELDDPDQNGIVNLLEYAFNISDSLEADGLGHRLPELVFDSGGSPKMVYRKNRAAAGLTYEFEASADLSSSASWAPVIPNKEEILMEDSNTRLIQATLPKIEGSHCFYRLRVSR